MLLQSLQGHHTGSFLPQFPCGRTIGKGAMPCAQIFQQTLPLGGVIWKGLHHIFSKSCQTNPNCLTTALSVPIAILFEYGYATLMPTARYR